MDLKGWNKVHPATIGLISMSRKYLFEGGKKAEASVCFSILD